MTRAIRTGQRLTILVGEQDRYHGRPLYEVLVDLARKQGLAGATVMRGVIGFGAHHRIHTAKILRLSEDLPLVIQFVIPPSILNTLV